MENNSKNSLYVKSLERGLRILEVFDSENEFLKLGAIADSAGITRSAAQRFVSTLVDLGYLRKNNYTREYSLSPRSLAIGSRYLQSNSLTNIANPYLHTLNRICEETCSLGERDELDIIYTVRFPAHKEMLINMPIGMRIPMYCNASGRAIMSCLPDDQVARILNESTLTKYTPNTIIDINKIFDRVEEARVNGFAWADSEYYQADINISAPIVNLSGEPIGAINISAAASRYTVERAREELGPKVIETARAISGVNSGHQRRSFY